MKSLSHIRQWKEFERLCADLLQAEGFHIDSEPVVDTNGIDIVAVCEYRSHGSGIPPIRVRWLVQCKHFAPSGTNLNRTEAERALVAFDAVRESDDGLLLMVSSDYTEPARTAVQQFKKRGANVMIWNQRQLMALLDRHGHLVRRYGLEDPPAESAPAEVPPLKASGPVLFVSDQSALAHECGAYLRAAGLEIVFLPHWNYMEHDVLELFRATYQQTAFGLCVCFLGDSFGLAFPPALENTIVEAARRGTPLLLFPFVAWMLQRGALERLANFVPVRLTRDTCRDDSFSRTRLFGEPRKGDFRWMLAEVGFEEDEYREYDPATGHGQFTKGLRSRFGLSHSFEYLEALPGSKVALADTSDNPLLVIHVIDDTRVAYINSCCHSCLTSVPIPSPTRTSADFRTLMVNALEWLLPGTTTAR
jgi:hypothetical protein